MVRAELPQDRLVHLESKFQILEREILVRRMRPAIGQGEPKEKRLHAENGREIAKRSECCRLRESALAPCR